MKKKIILLLFFGRWCNGRRCFFESLDFCEFKKSIPILFVCENNFYSVYSNLEVRQAKNRDISKLVQSHGIESFKGSGNDIDRVYDLSDKAINILKRITRLLF